MFWYGIEYRYGASAFNREGEPDRVAVFSSRRKRDTWVAAGPAFFGDPDYREPWPSRHVRRRQARLQYRAGYGWWRDAALK